MRRRCATPSPPGTGADRGADPGGGLLPRRAWDLRGTCIVTIDGAHSKDFDDAVSLHTLPDGALELGVHIADVSHYVPEGSPLDREALLRGTSVYYADQVIPMLPPELSDDLCSLRPHQMRYCLSTILTLGADGQVRGARFGRPSSSPGHG